MANPGSWRHSVRARPGISAMSYDQVNDWLGRALHSEPMQLRGSFAPAILTASSERVRGNHLVEVSDSVK